MGLVALAMDGGRAELVGTAPADIWFGHALTLVPSPGSTPHDVDA
jgi:hypothetical protein